jgi:hypothetical protein
MSCVATTRGLFFHSPSFLLTILCWTNLKPMAPQHHSADCILGLEQVCESRSRALSPRLTQITLGHRERAWKRSKLHTSRYAVTVWSNMCWTRSMYIFCWLQLVLQTHPDKNPDNEDASAKYWNWLGLLNATQTSRRTNWLISG